MGLSPLEFVILATVIGIAGASVVFMVWLLRGGQRKGKQDHARLEKRVSELEAKISDLKSKRTQ